MRSVDVIIPCYGYGQFLTHCVDSVLSQSGVESRALIIDDASPDNTAEVALALQARDHRVRCERHDANKGHIQTYNEGIQWATADYMLILSADDYLLPGALNRAVDLMENHPEVGFTFGNAFALADSGEYEKMVSCLNSDCHILSSTDFVLLSGSRNIVPTPTAVIRTELQHRVGGYRRELPHSGDMEMWLRLSAHASVGFIQECQAVYRRHSSNMSRGYSAAKDVQQRKAALDYFFQGYQGLLHGSERLRTKAYHALACEAVSLASVSFNEGKIDECQQAAEMAREISPGITTSPCWIRLALKRRLGLDVWRCIMPALTVLREKRNCLGL